EFALTLPVDPADYVSRALIPFGMYEVDYLEVTGDGRTDSMARTENGEWAGMPTAAGEAAVGAIANLPLTEVVFLPDANPPRPQEQAAYTLVAKSATGQVMTVRLWRDGDAFLVWREGEPLRARLAAAAFSESLKNFRFPDPGGNGNGTFVGKIRRGHRSFSLPFRDDGIHVSSIHPATRQ
ncbi:MAG: hypothetical protein AABY92_05340, partial [Thermodesulfobacteriota bacterium]